MFPKKISIDLKDSDISLYSNFFSPSVAQELFHQILEETHWKQEEIILFGKKVFQPRLTALFSENKKTYTYSGLTIQPQTFSESLNFIKKEIENLENTHFNICLANFYRDGQDSIGWHSDDEKELDENPIIASVSLGAARDFQFKNKKNPQIKCKLTLQSGDLLIMKGATQANYKHQIPKTKREVGGRINLTFRKVLG